MATTEIQYGTKSFTLPNGATLHQWDPFAESVRNILKLGIQEVLVQRTDIMIRLLWEYVHSDGAPDPTTKRRLRQFWQWLQAGEMCFIARDDTKTVLTNLAFAASRGDSSITVIDSTGITAGDQYILRDRVRADLVQVATGGVSGNVLTLEESLDFDYSLGARFRSVDYWPARLHEARRDSIVVERPPKHFGADIHLVEDVTPIPVLLSYVAGRDTLADKSGVFTRTGPGRYVDSDLIVQVAADGVARESHYAKSYLQTLLLEDTRTNDFESPDDFDNAAWTKTDTTITSDDIAGPQSGVLADLLTEGTLGTANVQQAETVASGATVAVTKTLKRGNHDWVRVSVNGPSGLFRLWVNLATEALGTQDATGTGTLDAARIRSLDDGWVKVSLVGSIPGDTSYSVFTASASADASTTRVNNATRYQGIAQFEEAAFESSLISGTRNAETAYLPFTPVPQAMTVYVRFVEAGSALTPVTALGAIWHIGGAAAGDDPRLRVLANGAGKYSILHDNGTSTVQSLNDATPAIGDVVEHRGVIFSDGSAQLHSSINGATEVSAPVTAALALGSAWADTRMYLNSLGTSNRGFNAFNAVKVLAGEQPLEVCRLAAEEV